MWRKALVIAALLVAYDCTDHRFPIADHAIGQARAQGPTLIQQSPTELRASQACGEARSTGAVTATITPPAGQFVYINSIEANAFAQAGAAPTFGTAASLTTTNITGTPTFGVFPMQAQAAGNSIANFFYSLAGNGLKSSAPGTAVTVVSPSVSNVGWHIAICGYFAP